MPTPDSPAAHAATAPGKQRPIVIGTAVVGGVLLAAGLLAPPASTQFYASTGLLIVVWVVGALVALAPEKPRLVSDGAAARSAVLGLASGIALLALFLLGAVVVAQVDFLVQPVENLLANAVWGALPVVTAITILSGVAEELYFRGALYTAAGGSATRRIVISTLGYTLVTAASGIALLVLAAALLGLLTGWLRHRTDGVLAPILAHLTWSVGMLYLLPPILEHWS